MNFNISTLAGLAPLMTKLTEPRTQALLALKVGELSIDHVVTAAEIFGIDSPLVSPELLADVKNLLKANNITAMTQLMSNPAVATQLLGTIKAAQPVTMLKQCRHCHEFNVYIV